MCASVRLTQPAHACGCWGPERLPVLNAPCCLRVRPRHAPPPASRRPRREARSSRRRARGARRSHRPPVPSRPEPSRRSYRASLSLVRMVAMRARCDARGDGMAPPRACSSALAALALALILLAPRPRPRVFQQLQLKAQALARGQKVLARRHAQVEMGNQRPGVPQGREGVQRSSAERAGSASSRQVTIVPKP